MGYYILKSACTQQRIQNVDFWTCRKLIWDYMQYPKLQIWCFEVSLYLPKSLTDLTTQGLGSLNCVFALGAHESYPLLV